MSDVPYLVQFISLSDGDRAHSTVNESGSFSSVCF